ncbi:MAG: thioredoxin [Thermoproteota archaeon]
MVEDEELERIKQRKKEQMLTDQDDNPAVEPLKLTGDNLEETVQENPLVVVDCWAPWCAPCRMIAPILDELAKDYAGKIVFGKLNVDENKEAATQYQIRSIPALLVFKDGKLIDRIVGAMSREKLEPKITRHL